jgi:hypothetical protein
MNDQREEKGASPLAIFSLDGSVGGDDEMSNRFLGNSNHFLLLKWKNSSAKALRFFKWRS